MTNRALKIRLSIPAPNTADIIPALHKFIDSVDELYRCTLDCRAVDLTIKCSNHSHLQEYHGTTLSTVLKKRKISTRKRKTRPRRKHAVAPAPFSPTDTNGHDDLKSIGFTKDTGQTGALAHSSNLNVGFLGSRASETVCTSASTAANEMRTCDDPLDE